MNRILKNGIGSTAALTLAVSLAACGGSSKPASGTGKSGSTVKVWIMGDDGKKFSTLTEGFTKDSGVKVNVEAIPWDNVNDKLTTAVASGKGPDVVQIGLSNLAAFQSAGALKDLTAELGKYPALNSANYLSAVSSDKINPGGPVVNVPWFSDTRVLFYRSDLLNKAGISAPPTTWAELHDDAVKLAGRGKGQSGYYIPQWDQSLPGIFTWQSGGAIADSTGKVSFDSAEFRKAADFYLSFYRDHAVPKNADFDQTQGFISGSAPMLISGPYLAKAITDAAPNLNGKWGVALLPKEQSGTSLFAGSNLGVWKNSTNVDGAMKLLDYLAKPATQLAWFKLTNELPTVKDALADSSLTGDPMVKVYVQQLQDAKLLPLAAKWNQIATEQLNALNDIALHGANEDKRLQQLNLTVDGLQK